LGSAGSLKTEALPIFCISYEKRENRKKRVSFLKELCYNIMLGKNNEDLYNEIEEGEVRI